MEKHLPSSIVRFTQSWPVPFAWLAGIVAAIAPSTNNPAQAQVIPTADGADTTVTQTGEQYDIEGGTQAGNNLFHEFDQFSLTEDQTANFLGDSSVFNIVGQVSEVSPSYIDGTVQVTGSEANLYLINPSGVLFGPNAQLSLQGSFTATTADQIAFEDSTLNVLEQSQDYTGLTGAPTALTFSGESAGAVV
ncbi:MAG: filamentous hemagglutinin N-terminal domain-containing protein, partial [Cyanobacteria bacterium J06650_10]